MRRFIYILFVVIISIGIIGFLGFGLNDEESLNDFKKESEFLIEKNEYERAIFYYDKILLNEPNSIKILSEKANALMFLNEFEHAIKIFDIVLDLDPTNNPAQESRMLAIQKMNTNSIQYNKIKQDEKFNVTDTLSQSLNPESTLKLNEQSDFVLDDPLVSQKSKSLIKSSITDEIIEANKLYEEKKYSEALFLYDAVLLDDPSNLYALNGKGGTLLSLKQFDNSIAIFEHTFQLYPDNINALNGKAYAYYLKAISMELPGLFYDSVHAYQNTLKVDPKNINALVGIASALDALERYDEAINYYDEVLSVDPNNKNAKNGLSNLWIKLGNYEAQFFYFDSAIVYFNKVLEHDPKNLPALLAMAASYAEWGKSKEKYYDISENIYTDILESYPNNTSALIGKGYVLSEQLRFEESLQYYERSLEIDPDNTNAKSGKSFVLKRLSDD